jgi:type I restriction enzyme M protein
MSPETHSQMANFIWSICNLLRGPYKRNEYRKVILPLTVLRRFDCILAPTKQAVLDAHKSLKGKSENIIRPKLCEITGTQFYNLSKLDFTRLLDDPNQLAPNLNSYINAFSSNVRQIMERFDFGQHVLRMAEKDILYEVVKAFADPKIDLSPQRIDNMQMGYIFEELIRIGAEQSNEEAGEHFTPREVIWLMVNLLLSDEPDLAKSHIVKTIYDPACGTGGMLSSAEQFIRSYNSEAKPLLYGQDWNDEAYAICKSDMLIKGEDADNIKLGDTFSDDGFPDQTFDYMLANPPFGVSWKQQQRFIEQEHKSLGYDGRFGAGLPRVNDGALLFLQHMISKMRPVKDGGSRIGIVFNGSPLFTGDAGSGESEIRRWIIENDWLEAVVALPDQLFYNTGISTYIWIVTNRKTDGSNGKPDRRRKVQLVDARDFWVQMKKSLGNKRHRIAHPTEQEPNLPDQIGLLTQIYGDFKHDDTRTVPANGHEKQAVVSKIFDNEDFGFHKITVERPLRLNFQATDERIAKIEDETAFKNLTTSKKKNEAVRQKEIAAGQIRQQAIRDMLARLRDETEQKLYKDRKSFLKDLKRIDREVTGVKLSATELKAVLSALGERDETAEICKDRQGKPEPDSELRDTEVVPLKESIEEYFEREVKPHVPDLPAPRPSPGEFCVYVLKCSDGSFYIGQSDNFPRRLREHEAGKVGWTAPRLPVEPIHWEVFSTREDAVKREDDLKTGFGRKWLKREYDNGRLAAASRQAGAWIDHSKTKVGYEIPLTRHFYKYQPPRPLEEIEADLARLEKKIVDMLKEVVG